MFGKGLLKEEEEEHNFIPELVDDVTDSGSFFPRM